MKRLPLRKAFLFALLPASVAVSLALVVPGCGLQQEGQRCDRNTLATHNGSDDCTPPLICKSKADLGGNSDICCPDGPSSNPACIPNFNGAGGSGATSTAAVTSGGGTGGAPSTSAATGGGMGGGSATSTSTATATSTGTGQ